MHITDNKFFKPIAALLPLLIIFGNISIFNYSVGGVVLTSYRMLIPVLCVVLIWLYLKDKPQSGLKKKSDGKPALIIFCCVILFWIAYGIMTLIFFKYSVFRSGAKEIMILILAAMSVVCLWMLCRNGCWKELLIGIRIAVVITIIIGFAEIITGRHLATSRFSDMDYLRSIVALSDSKLEKIRWKKATGIFYNENDFTAFLAVFTPVFIHDINNNRKTIIRLLGCLALGAVFFLLLADDSFICVIAEMLGVIMCLVFNRARRSSYLFTGVTLAATRGLFAIISPSMLALELSLLDQLNNMDLGYGSLLHRLNTYSISFTETMRETKGFGFGAGSYINYFGQFVETHNTMANPHCYWIEIFAEYGVIVFLLFVAMLLFLYIRIIVYALSAERVKASMILAMGAAFAVACIAPSSYMMNTYHWIPIGMAVWLVDSVSKNKISKNNKERNNAIQRP